MSRVGEYLDKIKEYSADTDIRQAYFLYLCSLVDVEAEDTYLCNLIGIDVADKTYYILLRKLFDKEYYWTVPNDDNRATDGKCLRDDFADQTNYISYEEIDGPCNMLELIIGIAKRMAHLKYRGEYEDRTSEFFWEILNNLLGDQLMSSVDDAKIDGVLIDFVDQKVDHFLERKYSKSGKGGIFPKKIPKIDQRKIELWSQMQNYLM